MHIYGNKGPQDRFALRKSEKIAKSEMFGYYVEEAKKITETEIKNSEYKHHAKESGGRNDLTDMLWDRYMDDIFENGGIFGGMSFNYNFLDFLNKNRSKNDEEELLDILSKQNSVDDGNTGK